MSKKSRTIDSILDEVNVNATKAPRKDRRPITVWLPIEAKDKYDLLQSKTNLGFGKKLCEVIEYSIEKKIGEAS